MELQQDLRARCDELGALLASKPEAMVLLNGCIEANRKLSCHMNEDGKESIQNELEEIQLAVESLFDSIASNERQCKTKLGR